MHIFHQVNPSLHPTSPGHPERPHRLMAAASGLSRTKATWRPVSPIEAVDISIAHEESYIRMLTEALPPAGSRKLDHGETVQSETSLPAALGALGGTKQAIDEMMDGKIEQALVLARAPGHHACRDRAMGFCILGIAAWSALYARDRHGLRVAVLDFDLHHGNGTEDILQGEMSVFFASSQEDGIWPGTGSTGVSGQFNHIVNTALPKNTGRDGMRAAWEGHFEAMRAFKPDLIVVSAGFDAHADDPLSGLNWSLSDYEWLGQAITDEARTLCGGRILTILEGGYDLAVLQAGTEKYVNGLTGTSTVASDASPSRLTNLAGMPSPYLKGQVAASGEGFGVIKLNRKLWIVDEKTGSLLYTPPEFVNLQSRDPLKKIAARATETGVLDINEIIALEAQTRRGFQYNKHRSTDFSQG